MSCSFGDRYTSMSQNRGGQLYHIPSPGGKDAPAQGLAPLVLLTTDVAMGAAGAAAPRILVRALVVLVVTQTLPARSMATPLGCES